MMALTVMMTFFNMDDDERNSDGDDGNYGDYVTTRNNTNTAYSDNNETSGEEEAGGCGLRRRRAQGSALAAPERARAWADGFAYFAYPGAVRLSWGKTTVDLSQILVPLTTSHKLNLLK